MNILSTKKSHFQALSRSTLCIKNYAISVFFTFFAVTLTHWTRCSFFTCHTINMLTVYKWTCFSLTIFASYFWINPAFPVLMFIRGLFHKLVLLKFYVTIIYSFCSYVNLFSRLFICISCCSFSFFIV